MKKIMAHLKPSSKLNIEESEVHFYVNDQEVTIKPGQVPSNLSLARFLRQHLNLTGTKIMCSQAGCGACVVTAYVPDETAEKGHRVISVNSCVLPVLSCDGWHVITVEGLGSRKSGMHPVQERLAAFHGTQCGFCSPGMVMQMNSFLEKNPNASMKEIEHILDGNLCRCTGYRPIHDAFKSFASDASENLKKVLADIEEAGGCQGKGNSICPSTGKPCGGGRSGNSGCKSSMTIKHQINEQGHWYMPESLEELLAVLEHLPEGTKYQLVGGNTGSGIYDDGPYEVFIDVKKVSALKKINKSPLEFGAGVVLNDVIATMQKIAVENEAYHYGTAVADHILVVANTAVRNTGSLAGNLMLKHGHQYFPSDIFLMMEALGVNIVVANANESGKECKYGLEEWLKTPMEKRVITKFCFPALSKSHVFRSFKITPRHVNAHAYVNAAFLLNVGSKQEGFKVKERPSLCFGGIKEGFCHASKTEQFLTGKNLNADTVKEALKILANEIEPHPHILEAEPKYRRNLSLGLLYKTILGIIQETLDDKLKSGATNIKRGVSKGQQSYKSDTDMWPMNQGIAKVEGKSQCTGEAQYIDDIPTSPGELHAGMVFATISNCELDVVDPSPALAVPGVRHWIDHTCVPGVNSWVPWTETEEIFSTGKIHYAGQCIGLILADTPELALKAVSMVKVTYKNKMPIKASIREAMKDPSRHSQNFPDFFGFSPKPIKVGDTSEHENREDLVKIEGEIELGSQYHFYMETLVALCIPKEDNQIQLYASTQWMDFTQNLVAAALGIQKNQIDMEVRRIGGGYGGKATPAFFVAVATSVASWKLSKPVRMVMDLKTCMTFTGKREEYVVKYKAGVDNAGCLQFVHMDLHTNAGWTTSESLSIAETITFAQNSYNSCTWTMTPIGIITDTPRSTACRAPGTVQGHTVIENLMDHMAAKLNMDPLEFRKKNFLKDGDMLLSGHPFHGQNAVVQLVETIAKTSDFEARKAEIEAFNKANKWKKRGISLTPVRYNIHAIPPLPFYCHISIFEGDGSVAVAHGGIEMGQGINTKVAQTVAKELGISMDLVVVKPSDTMLAPNNCVTGGSTTSEMTCHAAVRACRMLKERIDPVAKVMEGSKWHEIIQACFFQGVDLSARHMGNSIKDDCKGYDIWGAVVTEVIIDVITGERNVVRSDLIEDTGATINPEVDIGQIEGGFVFGLGWWLQERIIHDPETGIILTNDTWEYKPPTCYDIPEDFRTTLCETNRMEGTLGSKATGEPSILMSCSVGFAIRQALKAAREELGVAGDDAIPGWVKLDLPLTVEKQQLATGIGPEHMTF